AKKNMPEKNENYIYYPQNSHDLLIYLSEFPDALVFAGGTHIMSQLHASGNPGPERIASINGIKEYSKIIRKEKFIDVGSAVTLSKILNIGSPVINRSVIDALSYLGSPSIRNMATIGGHICIASSFSNLYPPLCSMDAQVELKSLYKSRWIPVLKFNTDFATSIKPMEVITRIRIPHTEWTYEVFRKVSHNRSQRISAINFCGLAKVSKGLISDIRFAFGAVRPTIFRSRTLESEFMGRKLPISRKEVEPLLNLLRENLNAVTDFYSTTNYRTETAARLIQWFIDELNNQV
ncbi:MAG: FAD binding domain-containing protein, partial [Spirochaetales bacterium]|nr:FAD binding domain-containing protein [Spirochaetales bacterium]